MTNTQRYTLFYQPEDAWVGDCMPCRHNGELYLYYQSDKRLPQAFPNCDPFGWSLAKTSDLANYTDFGKVLQNGAKNSRDEWLYAGSVLYANGCFWAFYTARCHAFWNTDTPAELVAIATSHDGVEWIKHPEWTLPKQSGYELNFFRDPCVFRDEEKDEWVMLAAQRHSEGPLNRRGVLTRHISKDLIHWDFQGDFWTPGMFYMLEMPDVFKMGDWWYLLFSEYSIGNRTRYRMSKSLDGPWVAPTNDCFDGRCLYAARTCEREDGVRQLVGWLGTRQDDSDSGMWVWGGTTVVYQLRQEADGTLTVHLPDEQENLFITSSVAAQDDISLSCAEGSNLHTLLQDAGQLYRLDCTVTFTEGTYAFGAKIYDSPEKDRGYAFHFSPGKNNVCFAKLPNYPWFQCQNRDLDRPLKLIAGKENHLTIIVDNDVCMLYVDGMALSARMCEKPGTALTLYVHGGTMNVKDIRFYDNIHQKTGRDN